MAVTIRTMALKTRIERGFLLAEKGRGPVYIVLHSGPNFGDLGEVRDTDADTVASLCWLKTGGSLLLSSMPRSRIMGIDMNRGAPGMEEAIEKSKDARYMNRYGWWAEDKKDYAAKLGIYRNFWRTARSLGNTFLPIHTLSCRLANFPSIMDLITFDSKGLAMKQAVTIAEKLNRKYAGFFSEISSKYREYVLFENRMLIDETLSGKKDWLQKEFFEKEMAVIKRFSEKPLASRVQKRLTKDSFLAAARSALVMGGDPRITVEEKFSGKKAFGPKENLLDRGNKVLEIELNHFLSAFYPKRARDIILDIIRLLDRT